METTEQGQPIDFNIDADSNINTITNTPEEIKQVKKSRGRPKKNRTRKSTSTKGNETKYNQRTTARN